VRLRREATRSATSFAGVAVLLAQELGQDEKWQADQIEQIKQTAGG